METQQSRACRAGGEVRNAAGAKGPGTATSWHWCPTPGGAAAAWRESTSEGAGEIRGGARRECAWRHNVQAAEAHLHIAEQCTPASKHSQYFLRQRDFRQRQPFLCSRSPLVFCSTCAGKQAGTGAPAAIDMALRPHAIARAMLYVPVWRAVRQGRPAAALVSCACSSPSCAACLGGKGAGAALQDALPLGPHRLLELHRVHAVAAGAAPAVHACGRRGTQGGRSAGRARALEVVPAARAEPPPAPHWQWLTRAEADAVELEALGLFAVASAVRRRGGRRRIVQLHQRRACGAAAQPHLRARASGGTAASRHRRACCWCQ